jgi:hypothetical protein
MSLGPAEGGFVELTLDREGTFPFVTHAFGDMVRGAIGALKTSDAPVPSPPGDDPPAAEGTGHGHPSGDGH